MHLTENTIDSSDVFFHTEEEGGINFYVLQFSSNSINWKDIYEMAPHGGGNYSFQIPYRQGFYRIRINEDSGNKFSWIINFKE